MTRPHLTYRPSSWILAAALVLAVPGVAHATGQEPGTDYVALGDSYSSGVGAGHYDETSGDCERSAVAYPALWANANAPASFAFTACSGARTDDVLSKQLGPLDRETDLVSISVGGNDAGFGEVMATCVALPDASCTSRVAAARGYVGSTLPGRLDQVYRAIGERAPDAEVVVLGYPRFYKLQGSCAVGLSETKRRAINEAAEHINDVMAKRAADHGFTFVDTADVFDGHEICSGSAWLHSLNWARVGDSYHPNAQGHSAGYLPAFDAVAP